MIDRNVSGHSDGCKCRPVRIFIRQANMVDSKQKVIQIKSYQTVIAQTKKRSTLISNLATRLADTLGKEKSKYS